MSEWWREAERLAEVLRSRLACLDRRELELRSGERASAVLVPLLLSARGGEMQLLLELRANNLGNHAGQVSFPGGAVDAVDGSVEDTALREAHEETGLPPESVEVLGRLGDLRTPTGFRITPVVGLVRGAPELRASDEEVQDLLFLPADVLLGPSAFVLVRKSIRGALVHSDAVLHDGRVIWGATARVLLAFRRLILPAGCRATGYAKWVSCGRPTRGVLYTSERRG